MGAPVVHWEINSHNAGRLQEFYSSLFDWKINADNPMQYGLVDTRSDRGAQGGIGQNDPNMPAPPAVTFYVEVFDLQATLDRAVTLGGMVVMPPTEIPGMVTLAMFTDPDGNTIGLVKEESPKPKRKPAKKKPARKPAKKSAKKKSALRKRRR